MPRLTVTVSTQLLEKLSRMSEHYGVTVSRLVAHSCDTVLQEGAKLALGPVSQNAAPVTQKSVTKPTKQRPPAKIDRTTYRVPMCVECGDEVAPEQIGPGDVHTDCPGSGQGERT